jgi:hypothetical protein
MNMSFRVDGLRFKTKTKRQVATVDVAQHICEFFFKFLSFLLNNQYGGAIILSLRTS